MYHLFFCLVQSRSVLYPDINTDQIVSSFSSDSSATMHLDSRLSPLGD